MSLPIVLSIVMSVLSVLLIAAILTQQQGTGLGGAFGGGGNVYRSKRGVEKTLFNATIVLAVLFVVMAFVNLSLR